MYVLVSGNYRVGLVTKLATEAAQEVISGTSALGRFTYTTSVLTRPGGPKYSKTSPIPSDFNRKAYKIKTPEQKESNKLAV